MELGRKHRTLPLKEKSEVNRTLARNLPQNKLGAVIFGCKHHTINECLQKKIFGLPAVHYSYVKNVTCGLTLFLFNYSDRKLHGIFEAVSVGQLNIDRHAWIASEGTEATPYAAQVRVKERMKCRPLIEEEFKPIIAQNYYGERLFWFELDKEQSRRLIKAFLPSPMPQKMPCPPNVARRNNNFDVLSYSNVGEAAVEESKNLEWEFASSSHKRGNLPPEACPGAAHTECYSYAVEDAIFDDYAKEIYETKPLFLKDHDKDDNWLDLTEMPSSDSRTSLDGEFSELKPSDFKSDVAMGPGEAVIDTKDKIRSGSTWPSIEHCERDHNLPNLADGVFPENSAMSGGVLMTVQSSDFESVIVKLMQEIEGLKVSQLKQRLKIDSLENELAQSKLEIDELKTWCHKLESVPSSACDHCDVGQESVLVVGGFDGCSWLPELVSFLPSEDRVISLCPMAFSRSYASVAKLNDELYVFGGVQDDVWYDIVESYNPRSNQWVQRPSLNQRKGSMAGASMYEKIFSIGGGNGVECFSEVEVFDPNIGRWIFTQPMLEQRFAPAAADMNGALYVAGGYDGRDYLRSVERCDPREQIWTSLGNMKTKRGCHSLVAFKEKLYALGGYDGHAMVSTVEVFDPRVNLWMMAEPMLVARGYFGSFVYGGKLYVIGGTTSDTGVLDVIECYEEGAGWQMTGMQALGKRCFFSTLVL